MRLGLAEHVHHTREQAVGASAHVHGQHEEAYRIFNASFRNLTTLTYDYVLARARRIGGTQPV